MMRARERSADSRERESTSRQNRERNASDRSSSAAASASGDRFGGRLRGGHGNGAIQRLVEAGTVGPKLPIDESDRLEREAERVADAVVGVSESAVGSSNGGPPPALAVPSSTSTSVCMRCRRRKREGRPLNCPDCEAKLERSSDEVRAGRSSNKVEAGRPSGESNRPSIQLTSAGRSSAAGRIAGPSPEVTPATRSGVDGGAVEAVESSLREAGPGRPLSGRSRAFFEDRLGRDLGDVRLHTGNQAAALNRALGARAFTYERDVFLGAGEYRPASTDGRRLLAHELTHTIQQDNGSARIQRFTSVRWAAGGLERAGRWTGRRIKSGAEFAWRKTGEGSDWLAGVVSEHVLDFGKARECAAETGASIRRLATRDFGSLTELLGLDRPDRPGPRALNAVVEAIMHPCLRMFRAYSWLVNAERIESVQSFLEGAWDVIRNPLLLLEPIREALWTKVQQVPAEAHSTVSSLLSIKGERMRTHVDEVTERLDERVSYMLDNWWPILLQAGREMIWPWDGAREDVAAIFGKVVDAGQRLWDLDIQAAGDLLLDALRRTNALLGRFWGWFFVASVLVGGAVGSLFGGVGAIPGMAIGAKVATVAGIGLLVSEVVAETANLLRAAVRLEPAESAEELDEHYDDIADSGLALGIMGSLAILGAAAARFARAVLSRMPRRGRESQTARGEDTGTSTTRERDPSTTRADDPLRRSWDDPRLTESEAILQYQNAGVRRPLPDERVRELVREGRRFNPHTRRWEKPHQRRGRGRDRAAANRFMRDTLKKVSDPGHPLHFLVRPRRDSSGTVVRDASGNPVYDWHTMTRQTKSGKTQRGRFEGAEDVPIVHVGHQGARSSGVPERFMLEDADLNILSGRTVESRGAFSFKSAVPIGRSRSDLVPVDLSTARMWERLGNLPEGTVQQSTERWGRIISPEL